MMKVIKCTNCGESVIPLIKLEYTYSISNCKECGIHAFKKWDYNFCNIDCQQRWIDNNEIDVLGFPCKDCYESGFAFGFKSNGVCGTCNGSKRK